MPAGGRRILVGAIAGAHGVRGEVRIKSFTADPKAIGAYGPLCDEAGSRRFQLTVTGSIKGGVLARIVGVGDRDQAAALKGMRLYVARDQLPPPDEPEEFYIADLVGLGADRLDGTRLGRVAAVDNYGAGDVVEIALEEGGSLVVPFTRQAVPVVDLAGGRLVVDPPAETAAGDETAAEQG
jgi:16S rRNA processing protein RimM